MTSLRLKLTVLPIVVVWLMMGCMLKGPTIVEHGSDDSEAGSESDTDTGMETDSDSETGSPSTDTGTESEPVTVCQHGADGDPIVTSIPELDGVLEAVSMIQTRTDAIRSGLITQVNTIAEIFAIKDSLTTTDTVSEIKAEFDTQIRAYLAGPIVVAYHGSECGANLSTAALAQHRCEALLDTGCASDEPFDIDALRFRCDGLCDGDCEGSCDIPSCTVSLDPSDPLCDGECLGTCQMMSDVAVVCDGICEGSCDGECSAFSDMGECNGVCSGRCQGTCSVSDGAALDCTGDCRGPCRKTQNVVESECDGPLRCFGACGGVCTGRCDGAISALDRDNTTCDSAISAACDASATAQASADLSCSVPSMMTYCVFKAGVSEDERATAKAKLDQLTLAMLDVIQGSAELAALVDGSHSGIVDIDSAVLIVRNLILDKTEQVTAGKLVVQEPEKLLCAITALEEATDMLSSMAQEMSATLTTQRHLIAMFSI